MIKQQVYVAGVSTLVAQKDLTKIVISQDEEGNDIYGDYYKHYKEDMTVDIDKINALKLEEDKATQIEQAKGYLQDTDYKVLPDYDGNTDGVLEARAGARAIIRGLEG